MVNKSNTPSQEKDSWRTPAWLFQWLNRRFQFEVDLAADANNALVDEFLTKDTDALARPWSKIWASGFLNCPYSNIDPWVAKAIEEQAFGFTTIMLIPSPNGEDRFADVFRRATEIIDIVGRIAFLRPDGTPVAGNTRGSSIYVFEPGLHCAPCRRWYVSRDEIMENWAHERLRQVG
jgi:phage N-6-adenine-methyltransferase